MEFIAPGLFGARDVFPLNAGRAENDDGARERRAARGVTKLQAALEKTDFAVNRIAVPPHCVRARRNQAHHGRSLLARQKRLLHPERDFAPVRRIHEDDLLGPILGQAILCQRIVTAALGVLVGRARIESEMKLPVERIKQPLGRGPEPDSADGEVHKIRQAGVKEAFYSTLASGLADGQVIVFENEDPPLNLEIEFTQHHFTKTSVGRYGFFPVSDNS